MKPAKNLESGDNLWHANFLNILVLNFKILKCCCVMIIFFYMIFLE